MSTGEAAHICAAAPGGPRYDESMTREERRSVENGIWLCDVHASAVDSKDSKFTVEELREWKRRTNEDTWRSVMQNVPYGPGTQASTPDQLRARLRTAASADLAVFRRTAKWPGTTVSLTLKISHWDEPLSTRALANAVTTLDDLVLVAPPGMGKTTTLIQIAEGVLAIGDGTPIFVSLGDWAPEGDALLASILKRAAFAGVSEGDFRAASENPGVVLLLDGWNELDIVSRERARVQITNLKAELPNLGLVISTRKQALDIPFTGTLVNILPLDDAQQMEIANSMRHEAGLTLLDQAWRTAGVRDLVSIPLYLTAILSLPEGAPFPTTKEEVLRRFVSAHEQDARRAVALRAVTGGCHQDYLDHLAVFATTTANTAIGEQNARRAVSETTRILLNDGQITITAQPDTVLDTFASNHVLVRSGDVPGYSFQHHQFQEWYASHHVERLMYQARGGAEYRNRLKAEILNQRQWEESILFAVDRTARGDAGMKAACGATILAAFDVDPVLSAEMIFRATDDVWWQVSSTIRGLIERWHTPGKVDRSVRFMITSGRPEFGDLLWPLIVHENQQVRLGALRAAKAFRPSVLGDDAAKRIGALPPKIRKSVLSEIASESGVDGIDLATTLAKADSDPEVKVGVVEALSFRRADRHIADLLAGQSAAIYDELVKGGHIDDIAVETVQHELRAARARRQRTGLPDRERLKALLDANRGGDPEGHDTEIADILAEMEIEPRDDERQLPYEIRKRYPQALANALLRRLRGNRTLFHGADDVLASAGFVQEDDELLRIAIADTGDRDHRAEAASSVLGPKAVGEMIDIFLAVAKKATRDANGAFDRAAADRYRILRARIGHTPGASLITAVQGRAIAADNDEIEQLAGLLSRETYGDDDRARLFTPGGVAEIGALAECWGGRLLGSRDTKRRQMAAIATLISQAPASRLLPILKRLLDEELRRYRAFREQAIAIGWRQGEAVNEARTLHWLAYQRAFLSISVPETDSLMREYLVDELFGVFAAKVLAAQWLEANEPKPDNQPFAGEDFSLVAARRAARTADPDATSPQAEAIFGAIERLISEGSTDEQKRLAVGLGIVGARLPHGCRPATIEKLTALASRQQRASLLLSLVLSGEEIGIKLLTDGIAETFAAAKMQPWILAQGDSYQLREWLCLLPFATCVSDIPAIVRDMPDAHCNPHFLEELVTNLGNSPRDEAEEVLFKLAEDDPRFYRLYQWRSTALRFGTASAARRLIDLTFSNALSDESVDEWHWTRELGGLIAEFPELRAYTYELLIRQPTSPHIVRLARAITHALDPAGLLVLIDWEKKMGRSLMSWWSSVESVVTKKVPSEEWKGSFNVVPVPAIELRKRLLAMTTTGGVSDSAARCLNLVDRLRDQWGTPEAEPRHPDLLSGKPWPIIAPDPDA